MFLLYDETRLDRWMDRCCWLNGNAIMSKTFISITFRLYVEIGKYIRFGFLLDWCSLDVQFEYGMMTLFIRSSSILRLCSFLWDLA